MREGSMIIHDCLRPGPVRDCLVGWTGPASYARLFWLPVLALALIPLLQGCGGGLETRTVTFESGRASIDLPVEWNVTNQIEGTDIEAQHSSGLIFLLGYSADKAEFVQGTTLERYASFMIENAGGTLNNPKVTDRVLTTAKGLPIVKAVIKGQHRAAAETLVVTVRAIEGETALYCILISSLEEELGNYREDVDIIFSSFTEM
jgi:hypothetical protein